MEKKVKFNPNVEIFEYDPYDDVDNDDIGFQLLGAGDKGMSEIIKRLLASHPPSDGVTTAPTSIMRANGEYNSIREGSDEVGTDLGVYALDFSETPYLMQSSKDSVQDPPSPSRELTAVKFTGKKLIRRRSDSLLKPIENQSQWNALLMQSTEDGIENAFHPSPCQEVKDVKFNHRRLNRSRYGATSVMKPIENLSQWKAAKSRPGAPFLLQTETDSTASTWRTRSHSHPSKYPYKDGRVNYGEEDEAHRRCEIKSTKAPFSLNAEARPVRRKAEKLNSNVRYRSQYLNPVLNPIANLSQWKAAIATS